MNLSIVPDRISSEEWSAVYQETLILLEKFLFLDSVKAGNGYCYAAQSSHRENVLEGYAGWCVIGDMHNGSHMESFFLISDIDYYKKKMHRHETNKQDILYCGLPEELKAEEPPDVWVWGAKRKDSLRIWAFWPLGVCSAIVSRMPHMFTEIYQLRSVSVRSNGRISSWENLLTFQ